MKNQKGFTLIELLVVIAIIGILSAVAIINLNSARVKARVAAVQSSLAQISPAAILCQDDGLDILWDTDPALDQCDGAADALPVAGVDVCDGSSAIWPDLTQYTGWAYTICDSTVGDGTWSFGATGDSVTITCTEVGCERT